MLNWYTRGFICKAQNVPYLVNKLGVRPEVADGLLAFLKSHPDDIKWMLVKIGNNPGKTLEEYQAIYNETKNRGNVRVDPVEAKIKELNITNPSNKLFLYRYGKKLDLLEDQEIKNEEDLTRYIHNELIPQVSLRMDKSYPDNNYVKDIDPEKFFQYAMDEAFVKEASEFKKTDPKKAKQIILDGINKIKSDTFHKWHNFLTASYINPSGKKISFSNQKDSAFVFMLLDQLFDSSPANKYQVKNMFPSSVEGLYKIAQSSTDKQFQNFSLLPTYSQYFRDNNCQGLEPIKDSKFAWLPIQSTLTDADKKEKNVERLTGFADGNGWCFGSEETAINYLKNEDFYLLLQDDRAVVAIAYDKKNSQAKQIKGRFNKIPQEFCYQVRDLLFSKNLNAEQTYEWKELKKLFKLEDDLENPEFLKKYIKSIEFSFRDYLVLPPKFKAMPEAKNAVVIGFCKFLKDYANSDPAIIQQIPEEVATDERIINGVKDYYIQWVSNLDAGYSDPPKIESMPIYIQQDPRIKEALKKPYINMLRRKPESIFDCPDWVSDLAEAKEAFKTGVDVWRKKIFASDNVQELWEHNNPITIPQKVRMLPQIQASYKAALLEQKYRSGEIQSKDIHTKEEELAVLPDVLKQIRINPEIFNSLSPIQQSNSACQQAMIDGWVRRFENVNQSSYGVVNQFGAPIKNPDIDHIPSIIQAKVNGWTKLLMLLSAVPARQAKLIELCKRDVPEIYEKLKSVPQLKTIIK